MSGINKAFKKLINNSNQCVDDSLEGFVSANPALQLLQGHRVVVRSDVDVLRKSKKVTILSGGGSGHEPAHSGYVGEGMLSGAIAGAVFASPPPNSILAAIRAVASEAGVLLIVKNYTGDRLNFGIASERAKNEGIKVEMVVVGDDCALESHSKTAGRRGLCGTILIHKIAGAMAENGLKLEDIVQFLEETTQNIGTIGISLSPCAVPGLGPSFTLNDDEIELGLGIHGEAGVKRIKLSSAEEVVTTMLDHMTNPSNSSYLQLNSSDSVVLIVNNLGGTSYLELGIVAKALLLYLDKKGVTVCRVYTGTFMTSLEMAGVSLSILKLDPEGLRLKYLDMETKASAWPRACTLTNRNCKIANTVMAHHKPDPDYSQEKNMGSPDEYGMVKNVLELVCQALIASEDQLNEYDRSCGDADCGTTLARGAREVLSRLDKIEQPLSTAATLTMLSSVAEETMGGCSGALYSLLLAAGARGLQQDQSELRWLTALRLGMQAISKYGKANVGDRTMLDSLNAISSVFQDHGVNLMSLEKSVQCRIPIKLLCDSMTPDPCPGWLIAGSAGSSPSHCQDGGQGGAGQLRRRSTPDQTRSGSLGRLRLDQSHPPSLNIAKRSCRLQYTIGREGTNNIYFNISLLLII